MSSFFSKVSGGITLCQDADESRYGARFAIYRYGENPIKALEAFYDEYPETRDVVVIPIPGYGLAPRPELCSRSSLEAALPDAREMVDAGSTTAQQWQKTCERLGLEFFTAKKEDKRKTVKAA